MQQELVLQVQQVLLGLVLMAQQVQQVLVLREPRVFKVPQA